VRMKTKKRKPKIAKSKNHQSACRDGR